MRNPNCTLCGLHAGARTVCVGGDGPRDAEILVVGQNPGMQEDRRGKPFIGPSGQILKPQLAKAGLGPKIRYTNIVRCVVGSTAVRFPSPPTVGYRRYYQGPLLTLKTACGHELTVTPNHPILTIRGWVAAQNLRSLQDSIYSFVSRGSPAIEPQINDAPVFAEQVFNTLKLTGVSSRVVGQLVDFHGDGINDEVEIVRPYRDLFSESSFAPLQFLSKPNVCWATFTERLAGSACPMDRALFVCDSSPKLSRRIRSLSSGLRQTYTVLERETLPESSQVFLPEHTSALRVASSRVASSFQPHTDSISGDPESAANLLERLPIGVALDQITQIKYQRGSAHVYNFSTAEEWYYAEGIITHNCLTPSNREPTAKEIKACKPYLDAEIKLIDPKYIIPLGALATKAVAKAKVSTAHGQMIKQFRIGSAHHDCHVMPTYHPAATFRDPSKLKVIQQDFARLKRHIDGTLGATQDAFEYRVVTDGDVLQEFFKEFDAAEDYAYDTETNGLFLRKPDFVIRCIAFALPKRSWVVPLEMPGSPYVGDFHAQAAFLRVVKRQTAHHWVCVWHGKYDSGAVKRHANVTLPYHFDAMLAHYLLDENQDHDLKYVSRIELDCEEYDLPKELKLSDNPKWLDLMQDPANREKYWKYNARDAWNTLHLAYKFAKKFRTNAPLRRLFTELAMPSSRALEAIEAEGLPIDKKQYADTEARITVERVEARVALDLRAGFGLGEEGINWNSPKQIARVLFDELGLPVQQRTPTGAPSTSEAAIVDLKGKHPIINELLHFRELDKILGTYLEGWKQYIVGNRIYFSYKQTGTVTGRMSSRLHQIPTDGDIRSIVAEDENSDWDFAALDLSQAELRIAAEMSGDTTLIDIYRKGQDVHWNTVLFLVGAGHMPEYTEQAIKTAVALRQGFKQGRMGVTQALETLRAAGVEKCTKVWKEWKTARTNAKRVSFGYLYGMYENTFIQKAKVDYDWYCTFAQAHAFRTGFFEVYPGLEPWHNRCKRIARIDGFVTNMFGRVRRLPAIQSSDKLACMEAERQAVNAPVQGTIADWKAAAMVEINETIDRDQFRLCGEHHDALLARVRRGCEDDVLPRVRKIMERPKLLKTFKIRMQTPMVVDVNVGAWGKGRVYRDPVR